MQKDNDRMTDFRESNGTMVAHGTNPQKRTKEIKIDIWG